MHICVSTITGRKEEFQVDSVSDLQLAIQNKMGIPIEEQKLLSNGKLLSNENLSENVQLIISLEGGAKGKRKNKPQKKLKKSMFIKKKN